MDGETSNIYLLVGVIFFLYLLSGFFAGAEAALFSLSRLKLKKMKDKEPKVAEIIEWLMEDPRKLLITILFCNLLVNTLLSSLSTILALSLAKVLKVNEATMISVIAALVTYLLIVISEVTPINLAINFTETFSKLVARPIKFITILLTNIIPVQPILTWITNLFLPLFGGEVDQKLPFISHAELYSTITGEASDGALDDSGKELLRSIYDFGETQAREIMTPRVDTVSVSSDETVYEVIQVFKKEGFNRLPVYQDNVDNIVGIVHVKDIFPLLKDIEKQKKMKIKDFMWEPFFVPETKMIDELLNDFQERKVQMAIVIDEYGGTEGIVTMEDVIEEIVGEIQDEYDVEVSPLKKLPDGSYLVDAKYQIDDLNENFGIEIIHEGFETLGGLVMSLLDKIPYEGAKVSCGKLSFEVKSVDGKRINKVIIRKNEDGEERCSAE